MKTQTRYRVVWATRHDGRKTTAPRFATKAAADLWRRLLTRDPAVLLAAVEAVIVRPVA
jgi:hypothetical protein